ncbi:PfkB family carbohydrate kinase [Spirosoma migulaei]
MKDNTFFPSLPTCVGAGLVALDVVISGEIKTPAQFYAGGSCGNVITILSFLGWSTYPIARLSNNIAAEILINDLNRWSVNQDFLEVSENGSTPIIIQRITRDKAGNAKHKFEFKNPEDGKYLPSYKPCLAKSVDRIYDALNSPNVFFFDRINKASIELAKKYRQQGTIIYFEPSTIKDIKEFQRCVEIADIVKFSHDRINDYDLLYPIAKAPLEIQTLGKEGLKFRRAGQNEWLYLKGFDIDNVIDTAGAGDWSTAGIIFTLFKAKIELTNIPTNYIIDALLFGQSLSALNCTFEGARGLMYNISRHDLLLNIQYILSLKTRKIPSNAKPSLKVKAPEPSIRISSLFEPV